MECGQLASVTTILVFLCLNRSYVEAEATEVFMSGAVPIREPDNRHPIMYSSVMPIIYKFRMPRWDLQTMKIQFWSNHNNCTESDNYSDGYPCPIMYHMNGLIDDFMGNMTSWKNIMLPDQQTHEKRKDFLFDPSILWSTEVCSRMEIEPHCKQPKATTSQIEKYVGILSQCTGKNMPSNFKFVDMTNVSVSLENQYHYTFTSFTSDYWKKLNQGNQESAAIIAWTTLQTTLMLHQYMESQKWTHAVETCKNQQVPWSLISVESLRSMLSLSLDESHDFSIPLENMSKYFKLPLADCIFGDDDTFFVRILAPLVPKGAGPMNYFVKFHPVPFQNEGKVCSLWNGRESIPFNVGLNGILPCSCAKSDVLCKGWHARETCASEQEQESCVHALHSDLEEEITAHCHLKCENPNNHSEQEITVSRNGTLSVKVISAPSENAIANTKLIRCSEGKAMVVNFANVGAYEISMPSQCRLVTSGASSSVTSETVDMIEGAHVKHLMPYHWRAMISSEDDDNDSSSSFVNSVGGLEGLDSKVYLIANKLQALDQYCNSVLSDTFLWLFVVTSLVMNFCLAVIVFKLYKWRKFEAYKSSRLVYSISSPQEDDFPVHDAPGSPLYTDVH